LCCQACERAPEIPPPPPADADGNEELTAAEFVVFISRCHFLLMRDGEFDARLLQVCAPDCAS